MLRSTIIERGRRSLMRELLAQGGGDYSLDAYRAAEARVADERSPEELYLAGQVAEGRAEIYRRNSRPRIEGGGLLASLATAAARADRAASMATEYEALTAFKRKQITDRVATAAGVTLAAVVIGGGLWYANRNDAPVDDLPLQSPETTDAPFPNYSEDQDMQYQKDMRDIYGNNDREMALPPITTSTPIPPATPLYS